MYIFIHSIHFIESRFRRDGQNAFEGKQVQSVGNRPKRAPSNREQQENGKYVSFIKRPLLYLLNK